MCRRWNIIRFVTMEAQWVEKFTGRAYWIITALEHKARIFGLKNGKKVNENKFLFRNDFTALWEGKKVCHVGHNWVPTYENNKWFILMDYFSPKTHCTAASCKIYSASPKGQLISEWLFGVFNFP